EFDSSHDAARYDYVRVLHKRQKFAKALVETKKLLRSDPYNLVYKSTFAAASLALGKHETALLTYEEIVKADSADPKLRLYHGHALKTVGRAEDAIRSYRRAYTLRPDFGDAWWSLANLKTYCFEEAEVRAMVHEEATEGVSRMDRYQLCFALGKA